MKRILCLLTLSIVSSLPAGAAGLLRPKDSTLPPLQIQSHSVKVVINNGFAVTEVDQVFRNPHDQDLEAIYTFPLPKDASLSELSLWIDGEEVVGEVVEKEQAREVYEGEKKAGRDAAVAEKRDYIAFDVSVSPVRAKSDTRVRLLYLQPLDIDSGVGRYVYPLEEGNIDSEAQVFWERLPQVHGVFSFDCTLRTSYPVDEVRAKGYESLASVRQESADTWRVQISSEEGSAALDQDVVVYYRLSQSLPARVEMLAHREGSDPGSFLLVITPGVDLQPISEGVDWTFVLDVSGSMEDKIATAAEALTSSLGLLRTQDRFRIIIFSNGAEEITAGWTPVTPESVEKARESVHALKTRSGTNLYAGFLQGLSGLEEGRTSAIILISDGGANVGPTEHQAFLKLLDKKDVRVFTFVMGQGANQPLLGRLAEESNGFSMDVSNRDDLYGRIVQAKSKLAREALHGVRLEIDGIPVSDLAPARLPSTYYGQQITVFGHYSKPGEATVRLRARISGAEKVWETRVNFPQSDAEYPELERLWALARIHDFEKRIHDEGKESELRQAVVNLGTQYSIVTDYTSMIVVSEERFKELGIDRKN
ncbi:MAG TPA: VIT and VWA domain-containing protein, partial [Candidatus Polarisedimenticolia bacterium]|nr:VIT and VWA domain-containing protein [Candidatus Polarisedimenticolia bacterium]